MRAEGYTGGVCRPIVGDVTPLFSSPALVEGRTTRQQYDVSRDGNRFLLVERVRGGAGQTRAVHIVENWYEEFRDRDHEALQTKRLRTCLHETY